MESATPYPILSNAADFEDVAQVEKINTIVKGQYNHYLEKTIQKKEKPTRGRNLVRGFSNTVANLYDVNYGMFNYVNMDFSTVGMSEYNMVYPILKINPGRVPVVNGVVPEISFVGVDKTESWEELLNEYGSFVFSFNRLAQEQQLSFRTHTKEQLTDKDGNLIPIKQTGWHVTLYFYYEMQGDK